MAKKRDKQERKILDSQERAFWDVYRPSPGQVNTTETDIKKMYKLSVIFGQEQALVGTEKTELSQLHRELAALQVLTISIDHCQLSASTKRQHSGETNLFEEQLVTQC